MAWGKKELPTYPALGFELGEFVQNYSEMNESKTKVVNTLYFEKGKVVKGYSSNSKTGLYDESISQYIEMKPEAVKAELEKIAEEKKKQEEELIAKKAEEAAMLKELFNEKEIVDELID